MRPDYSYAFEKAPVPIDMHGQERDNRIPRGTGPRGPLFLRVARRTAAEEGRAGGLPLYAMLISHACQLPNPTAYPARPAVCVAGLFFFGFFSYFYSYILQNGYNFL